MTRSSEFSTIEQVDYGAMLNIASNTHAGEYKMKASDKDKIEIQVALKKGKCRCGGGLLEGPCGGMAMNVSCDKCKGRLNIFPMGLMLVDILEMPDPKPKKPSFIYTIFAWLLPATQSTQERPIRNQE